MGNTTKKYKGGRTLARDCIMFDDSPKNKTVPFLGSGAVIVLGITLFLCMGLSIIYIGSISKLKSNYQREIENMGYYKNLNSVFGSDLTKTASGIDTLIQSKYFGNIISVEDFGGEIKLMVDIKDGEDVNNFTNSLKPNFTKVKIDSKEPIKDKNSKNTSYRYTIEAFYDK